MNIKSQKSEEISSELELSIINPLLDAMNHLIASVKQKSRQTGMSSLAGEQVTALINGNAFQDLEHLSIPAGSTISAKWLSDPSTNTDPSQRSEEMDKLSINLARHKIYSDEMKKLLLGTLPDSNKKENTMFRNQDCFDIPAPSPYAYGKNTVKSTQANIDLQVNMPPAQDPALKGKDHLLRRAAEAQNTKYNDLRKAFHLDDDAEPATVKDFIQRIRDGKFVIDLTEKEQAERTFWSTERLIEEFQWRDPSVPADEEGFEKATAALRQSLNDVSDEIIVKTPEAGLEALRAFQAKTFH
jgi:hypothetical protein